MIRSALDGIFNAVVNSNRAAWGIFRSWRGRLQTRLQQQIANNNSFNFGPNNKNNKSVSHVINLINKNFNNINNNNEDDDNMMIIYAIEIFEMQIATNSLRNC